jgi:cyclic beta-1,2-glucan synthetase
MIALNYIVYILLFISFGALLLLIRNISSGVAIEELEIYDAILSNEDLERHASDLARMHVTGKRTKLYHSLDARMNKNFKYIMSVYKHLNENSGEIRKATPASEWLLDNFYIIEEQVKEIRQSISKKYFYQLPRLKNGSLRGYPRVYAIALELISHTDGRFDEKTLVSFVTAYQNYALLSSGELWVLPIMVRIALIENIRRICDRIMISHQQWYKAEKLADILLAHKDKKPEDYLEIAKDHMKQMETIDTSFGEHLLKRLKKYGMETAIIIKYFDDRLAEQNINSEGITQLEHKDQAMRQVSMGNSITSVKLISTLEWAEIFEKLSQVELIMRQDPSGIYSRMDFKSRDYYRHEIEKLAKQQKLSEISIAKKLIATAEESNKHVGYFLFGKEKEELYKRIGSNYTRKTSSAFIYIASIYFVTFLLLLPLLYYFYQQNTSLLMMFALTIIILLPVNDVAVTLVNWVLTHTLQPDFLPKMELKEGIPEDAKTIVVIPTLLSNPNRVQHLVKNLEEYYLANRENNLYFALVGDFKDSKTAEMKEDSAIVTAARHQINVMNKKYAKNNDVFFYLHRERVFIEKENRYMGWERKRGALVELNELLLGSNKTSYKYIEGDIANLKGIKYVITLDADTRLIFDTAKKLIGAMLHPLNTPVMDEKKQVVKQGYGLLQPRINIDIESANATPFAQIFAGQGGIDIYTTAISDVYQDMFKEGIFTGKGIYDLKVFHSVLDKAIPANTVLSHDLIEGSYVRTGLLTDMEFFDGFPSKYNAHSLRLHRWVRGDWQLLPWLFGKVIDSEGSVIENPLSVISRWKIFDNLRRSLLAPAYLLLIAAVFTIFKGNVNLWISLITIAYLFPIIVGIIEIFIGKMQKSMNANYYNPISEKIINLLSQGMIYFSCLPYQAYLMLSAIIKTLIRVLVTKRNMLEWITAADMEVGLKNDLSSYVKRMWVCIAAAALLTIYALFFRMQFIAVALIISVIWALGPIIAHKVSQQCKMGEKQLTKEDLRLVSRSARKTWSFFEDFVTVLDNYLPPDNYQLNPPNGIAHRTSPTNIGLLLLSTLAARDLGYLSSSDMVDRISKTIKTIDKLSKWKGHLYNWYDTVTMGVLRPHYISTVDSGNLVACLISLKQGLIEYMNKPLVDISLAKGLLDTIEIANEELENKVEYDQLKSYIDSGNENIREWYSIIRKINISNEQKKNRWGYKIYKYIYNLKNELEMFLPKEVYESSGDTPRENQKSTIDLFGIFVKPFEDNSSIESLERKYLEANDKAEEILNKVKVNKIKITSEESKQIHDYIEGSRILIESIAKLKQQINEIIEQLDHLIDNTEFTPLYCPKRKLFSIGYNVEEEQLTKSFYDLMASEARQASLIAIARGEVKREHWLMLDRTLTMVEGQMGLVSWTGTMFEYLMPLLLMKSYKKTLWAQTYKFVIKSQRDYGRRRKVPWGVSESGFYSFDFRLNYQYKAFGIPNLGLKRGLIKDTVISPYSTLLALGVEPKAAVENMRRLIKEGLEGQHGFYEAADYTPERLSEGRCNIVQSYMAHHQGMGLVAMDNMLNKNVMQERFHSYPQIRAAEILLQEKIPSRVIFAKEYKEKLEPIEKDDKKSVEYSTVLKYTDRLLPEVHLISNGSYSVMLTDDGSGYSKYNDIAVTRWREDSVQNKYGIYLYLRDIDSNEVWNAALAPNRTAAGKYSVTYSQDKAVYSRSYGSLDCQTDIIVSPEDDVEIRKISITNHSNIAKTIETTSYYEAVLAPQASDIAHPAFSNLFIKTEYVSKYNCLLAVRRPREEHKDPIWMLHSIFVENEIGGIQYETDRGKFIGRGRDITNPMAIENNYPLSNSVGAVIDPIMSLRGRLKIEPGQTAVVSYIVGVVPSREKAIELADKYNEKSSIDRAFELAWTRSQVELNYLNLSGEELECYRQMLSHLFFISPTKKKYAQNIMNNKKGQSGLWSYGISGDMPMVLVIIKNNEDVEFVREVLKAHEFWRVRGLNVDMVILAEDQASYTQPIHDYIQDLLSITHARDLKDRAGGVFLRQGGDMPQTDKDLLITSARLVLHASEGPIMSQLKIKERISEQHSETWQAANKENKAYKTELPELDFYNGYGGFDKSSREYVIRLQEDQNTPLPWINVITNGSFGFQISESGGGYTWAENSRENKLTAWSNDPISDPQSEVIYLRDEETGEFWSLTPQPVPTNSDFIVRHGFGYSVFESAKHGIEHSLTLFTPLDASLKLNVIALKNVSNSKRKLSIISYIRPIMGVSEQNNVQHIFTKVNEEGAILAGNTYNNEFPDRVLFLDSSIKHNSITGDRREFLGKNGSLKIPAAMKGRSFSDFVGAGVDPCCSIQDVVELTKGETLRFVVMLGQCQNDAEVKVIAGKYKSIKTVDAALDKVKHHWAEMLTAIKVTTPDMSMDIMLNGWLLYQTIACRMWARAALYQVGGAFGFRDQLQDSMAVAYIRPELTRKQILYHSEHQFIEGDVQHWWHPVTDKGIRTRFSDDLLWMPYVTADYIKTTRDTGILHEQTGYISEACLKENEDERYNKPCISDEMTSLYEHCIKAIEHSLKFGQHGIPLMGSGDWNDGMNTVGNKGKGESVWLGWFLYSILESFAPICKYMDEGYRADRYLNIAAEIKKSIEENAWDGSWYRRAYFDNGIPLGSAENTECKIDSLAQSWAVISGAGEKERIDTAFESLEHYLINREIGIIMLLTPPFDEGDLKPGYIKSYIPGVRENGGQYTHAAAWVIMAYALMGNGDKAWELYNMLVPINHANTLMEASRYKVEPYVMAADVYAVQPHAGRGGWSWYTGASGWMYRVALQNILGFNKMGDKIVINPCIPKGWKEYQIEYLFKETKYIIEIKNPEQVNSGIKSMIVDGMLYEQSNEIILVNDGKQHIVEIIMG